MVFFIVHCRSALVGLPQEAVRSRLTVNYKQTALWKHGAVLLFGFVNWWKLQLIVAIAASHIVVAVELDSARQQVERKCVQVIECCSGVESRPLQHHGWIGDSAA